MSWYLTLFWLLGLLSLCAGQAEDCMCLEEIVPLQNLNSATIFLPSPDGTGRQFLGERYGVVWILMPDNTVLSQPFLNISSLIFAEGDCGFQTLAFHPQYAVNGKFYMTYCSNVTATLQSVMSEMVVSQTDPNIADPDSLRILIVYDQIAGRSHAAAGLMFGDDDYLYFGTGDGGLQGDPTDEAQNKTNILGNVLRLDVDTRTGELEYGIPPDNPFLDEPQTLPEIYAYGFRHPWRITMDTGDRDTGAGRGRIFIGDIGQNTYEELDLLQAGGNYGWAGREGFVCYKPELCGETGPDPEILPLLAYNHSDVGRCIIGGYVYRGCLSPSFNGVYFFSDCMSEIIFRLWETSPGVYDWGQMPMCGLCPDGMTNTFGKTQSWGVDQDGEMYVMAVDDYNNPDSPARVYKVFAGNNTGLPCA